MRRPSEVIDGGSETASFFLMDSQLKGSNTNQAYLRLTKTHGILSLAEPCRLALSLKLCPLCEFVGRRRREGYQDGSMEHKTSRGKDTLEQDD